MNFALVTTSLVRGGADNLINSVAKILIEKSKGIDIFTQRRSKEQDYDYNKFIESNCSIKMPFLLIESINLALSYLIFPLILFLRWDYYCHQSEIKYFLKLNKKCQLDTQEILNQYYLALRVMFNNRSKKYDYIFLFHYSNIFTGIHLSKLLNAKIIYIEISSPKWRVNNNIFSNQQSRFIQNHVNKSFAGVIVPSENIKKEFLKSYSLTIPMHIIPFIVELNTKNYVFEPQYNTFGMVGRLVKEKGFDTLIKSLKILFEDKKNYKLAILGDGPEKNNLIEMAKSLGVEDSFCIYPCITTVEEFMSSVDLITSMSHVEGMSLALNEALAYSKPIIATDVGSNSSLVIEGKNGYILEQPNEDLLAQAIKNILEDKNKYDKYSKESYLMYKEKFSSDVIKNEYYKLLTV